MTTKKMDKKPVQTFDMKVARFRSEVVQSVLITEENMEAVSAWYDGQILVGPNGKPILKIIHRGGIALARVGSMLVKTKGNVLIVFSIDDYNELFYSPTGKTVVLEENG